MRPFGDWQPFRFYPNELRVLSEQPFFEASERAKIPGGRLCARHRDKFLNENMRYDTFFFALFKYNVPYGQEQGGSET